MGRRPAVLSWVENEELPVILWALCDFAGIPEAHLFYPGTQILKSPSEIEADGVVPESIWRPYAR